jgi:hypothetical protein
MIMRVPLLALLLAASLPAPVAAQVRASERATVSQVVDGTVFTIAYSRPRVRGRDPLFGGTAVRWGETWTPGANWATTLEVSRDVKLDGHAVPRGKYSVWFVVRRPPAEWTVVLDPRAKLYHVEHPDSTAEQVRWTVRPAQGAFTEVLSWSFPDIRPDGGTIAFQWGTTRVSLDAVVAPSHPLTIARSEVEPYLGKYALVLAFGADTVHETLELYYEDGSLKHRYARPPPWYPLLQNTIMVRINDDWFIPVIMRDGKPWEMAADVVFEFTVVDGKATTVELRDDQDELLGRGTRIPVDARRDR